MPCPIYSKQANPETAVMQRQATYNKLYHEQIDYGNAPVSDKGFSAENALPSSHAATLQHQQKKEASCDAKSNCQGITPRQRSEVSRAVFDIIQNNLPLHVIERTPEPQLALIARAIEKKMYQVASSPRTYTDFSTVELRLTALASAILLHTNSSKQNKHGKADEASETSHHLLSAVKSSLRQSVIVLVSYEKRQIDEIAKMRIAMSAVNRKKNEATSPNEYKARCGINQPQQDRFPKKNSPLSAAQTPAMVSPTHRASSNAPFDISQPSESVRGKVTPAVERNDPILANFIELREPRWLGDSRASHFAGHKKCLSK